MKKSFISILVTIFLISMASVAFATPTPTRYKTYMYEFYRTDTTATAVYKINVTHYQLNKQDCRTGSFQEFVYYSVKNLYYKYGKKSVYILRFNGLNNVGDRYYFKMEIKGSAVPRLMRMTKYRASQQMEKNTISFGGIPD